MTTKRALAVVALIVPLVQGVVALAPGDKTLLALASLAASKDVQVLRVVSGDEDLLFKGVRRSYRYDGARVSETVVYPDSAPKPYDHTFDQPVFAFNEVEPLVRSLDYRRGLRVVVPLFSEVDQALERDTLSVESGSPTRATWVIRFADPVITTRYVVDARTRHIVDAVTTNRKSGGRYHYRY